jgi:tripartite-type tricarboxylate transporter receptor subunit TctC
MKFTLIKPLMSVALMLGSLALTQYSQGADVYPNKPIRLVCPFTPGGAVDMASRAIALELSKNLGQPVTVDNRPGAGGNIGGSEVAHAAPDGYTLMVTTSAIQAINPALYSKMPFNPSKDFAPIGTIVSMNNVLVVGPGSKIHSVQDLISMAKASPGQLNYASSGSGTSIHMSGEMFKSLAKVDLVHIPYKGSSPALTDLMGGQVMMMFDNIPASLPFIKTGKLRPIATTGAKRDPFLPDLPTIAESGVQGYESGVWFGLVAPANTPKEIINKLNAEMIKGTKSAEFVKRMTEAGYIVSGSTPEQMAELDRVDVQRWGAIVRASGARAD